MLRRDKSLSHALRLSAACLALSVPSLAFAQEAPQADDTAEEEIVEKLIVPAASETMGSGVVGNAGGKTRGTLAAD